MVSRILWIAASFFLSRQGGGTLMCELRLLAGFDLADASMNIHVNKTL